MIAIACYGVQTYLAATALDIVFLKFWPSMASLETHKFAGLSALGYISYAILWVVQGAVFWKGMGAIRKFIDWAGPAVYVVMLALCGYLVAKAGWSVKFAESLAALGVRTSKRGEYAPPPPKAVTGLMSPFSLPAAP